jgi:hypothetical protein
VATSSSWVEHLDNLQSVDVDFPPANGTTTRLSATPRVAIRDGRLVLRQSANADAHHRLRQTCGTFKEDPIGRVNVVLGRGTVVEKVASVTPSFPPPFSNRGVVRTETHRTTRTSRAKAGPPNSAEFAVFARGV